MSDFISKLGGTNWDDRVTALQQARVKQEAEASAAQQMKAEYEAKQAAENAEAMSAFWSGFRWFMLFALVIGIFVYGYIKEKRKKEQLAREEEARQYKLRTLNNRNLSAMHTAKGYLSKMQNDRSSNILFSDVIEKAKNAAKAIENILIANRTTSLAPLDDFDKLEHEYDQILNEMPTSLDAQIQLAIEVDSKIKSVVEFADGFDIIANDTMRIIDASDKRNTASRFGKKDWLPNHAQKHVLQARGYAANIKTVFQKLDGKMALEKYSRSVTVAEAVRDGILKEMTQLKSKAQNEIKAATDYCKSMNEHIDYMEKASNYVASNRNRVNSLISDAEYAVNKRDVKSSTKSMFDAAKRRALSLNTHDSSDIVSMYSALSGVINELDSVISQSKKDIRNAEEERAEAIRRERRRKEQEEEEDRRRRDSYSSSSSSSYDSGSSSSSSSYDSGSSSSFGGGDSGGGGASGDW